MQGGKGSWGDAGDSVVIQRQQTHRTETRESAVVDAADLVAPEHSGNIEHNPFKYLLNLVLLNHVDPI